MSGHVTSMSPYRKQLEMSTDVCYHARQTKFSPEVAVLNVFFEIFESESECETEYVFYVYWPVVT